MSYATNIYHFLLQNLFWSITPALPQGAPGLRPHVGTPEHIPDVTFITRRIRAADVIVNNTPAERQRLNGFIDAGRAYHNLYGLNPIPIGSLEEIINHFHNNPGPIGRIRMVTHGNDQFIFAPLFQNGSWLHGIEADLLDAFRTSDAQGLRFLLFDRVVQNQGLPGRDTIFEDVVSPIVSGLRNLPGNVLNPFGLQGGGLPPAGPMLEFFRILNDQYQVPNGTFRLGNRFLNANERQTITTALEHIEASIRQDLINTTPLTDPQLTALKTTLMNTAPADLGLFGIQDFHANIMADVAAAMAAAPNPNREDDIRLAFTPGSTNIPILHNNMGRILSALPVFNNAAMTLGGQNLMDLINPGNAAHNPDVLVFFLSCTDLFTLQRGKFTINGAPLTNPQRQQLRAALTELTNIIRSRVRANTPAITNAQLNRLRQAISGLTSRQAFNNPRFVFRTMDFRPLNAANTAVGGGFRNNLDHFRNIMRDTNHIDFPSRFDIRGCLVGQTPGYLDHVRDFLGTGVKRPTVSAPNLLQSFPASIDPQNRPNIYREIDNLVNNGVIFNIGGANTTWVQGADVLSSFAEWRGLIAFGPHFQFIVNLFANDPVTGAPKFFEFAVMEWNRWAVGAVSGIPILNLEASRIDNIAQLNLNQVIERFGVIFELPAAGRPAANVRRRLNTLRQHLVIFRNVKANVTGLPANPQPAVLQALRAQLNQLDTDITGIQGYNIPPGAPPLRPANDTKLEIEASVQRFDTHIANILSTDLNAFFGAVQTRLGEANAELKYLLNICAPLLVQGTHPDPPDRHALVTYVSAPTNAAARPLIAGAIRSWMRIQWQGTQAQANATNVVINRVNMNNLNQRVAASRVAMLTEENLAGDVIDAHINPQPDYAAHIVSRP